MSTGIAYRPEIDGLRALAVVPVILFHAGVSGFDGGFVGVDVFFVISGFLITSLILADADGGRFTYTGFYVRRARRILPALLLVMVFTMVIAWMLMVPSHFRAYAKTLIAVVLFGSNIWLARGPAYFDNSAETNPLLHTWSLAVEEQYYLLFPLLVGLALRMGRCALLVVLLAVLLVSLGLAEFGSRAWPTQNFYWLSSRAWELMLGSVAAFGLRISPAMTPRRPAWGSEVLAFAGLVMILVAIVLYDRQTPFPGIRALLPTVGTLLVLVFATRDTWIGKVFALRPLVGVGLLSYSAYLWHQPLLAYARLGWGEDLGGTQIAALVVLTFALSLASWRFVERPFRNPVAIPRRLSIVIITAVAALVLVGALVIDRKGGFPQRLGELEIDANGYGGAGVQFLPWQLHGPAQQPPAFVIYGDSHALQYIPALARQGVAFASITHSACLALPGLTNLYQQRIQPECLAMLDELDRRVAGTQLPVVVIQRWNKVLARPDGTAIGRIGTGQEGDMELLAALDRLRERIGPSRKIIIVGNVPTTNLIALGGYIACRFRDLTPCPDRFPEAEGELYGLRALMRAYAASRESVRFFDPYDVLCSEGMCRVAEGDRSYYSDHAHLSVMGAEAVVSQLIAQGVLTTTAR